MLTIKEVKLTRGSLLTLVEPQKPCHRKIVDAYFATLGKMNKESLLINGGQRSCLFIDTNLS
jgi:hypothetical protein